MVSATPTASWRGTNIEAPEDSVVLTEPCYKFAPLLYIIQYNISLQIKMIFTIDASERGTNITHQRTDVFEDSNIILGATSGRRRDRSPLAFVREPEGNGCAERFIRTRKEHVL
jgi:hypothetical protein